MYPFKHYREAAGLRQIDAAKALGVGQTTISVWETGEGLPRADLLPKIASLYNCTVDELLNNK